MSHHPNEDQSELLVDTSPTQSESITITAADEARTHLVEAPSTKSDDRLYDMMQIALEKGNAEALETLVNLQNKQQDRQREEEFEVAFAEMQADLPAVLKNRFNEQTKSRFSKLDDIQKAIKPVLKRYGFSIRYESPDEQPERVVVATCILTFKNGWKAKNTSAIPVDNIGIKGNANKTEAHGAGSATTYARRYALCGLLDITLTEDDDGNAAGGEPRVTSEQQIILHTLLEKASEETKQRFHSTYPSAKDVEVSKFAGVVSELKRGAVQ